MAFNTTLSPLQKVMDVAGIMVAIGNAFTVTVSVALGPSQPAEV